MCKINGEKSKRRFAWIKKQFVNKQAKSEAYIASLRATIEQLKEQNQQQEGYLQERRQQLENIQIELAFVLNQKKELVADVFSTRKEFALKKMQTPELSKAETLPLHSCVSEVEQLKEKLHHECSLHKQLRSQFITKTELLIQARKELFGMETEIFHLQKKEQKESSIERNLSFDLRNTAMDLEELQSENALLENLVSTLISDHNSVNIS